MPSTPACEAAELRHRPRAVHAAVLVVAGAAFVRTIGHAFLLWDDSAFITENPLVAHPSVRSFVAPWTSALLDLYAPLTYVAWAALSAVSGLAPWAFHALNVALHVLNTSAVLALLRDVAGEAGGGAAAGALLFALHPVQVETIAWASETKDLLAAFFSLIAMRGYLMARERDDGRLYAGASLSFACALLAKASAVVAPLLLAVLNRMRYGRGWRESLRGLEAWILAAAAVAFLTTQVQPAAGPLRWTAPVRLRPVLALDALSFYVATLVLPFRLVPDYGRTTIALLATGVLPYTWIPSAALLAAAWAFRRRLPAFALGVALFVAGLLPVLGFVPFDFQYYSNVADHYLYLPMLGPAVALALGYRALPATGRALVGVTLALLFALAVVQTGYWADDATLYSRILAVNPLSSMAHSNLGRTLERRGQLAAALLSYREALRIDPGNEAALVNIGNVLYEQGDYEGAIGHYAALLAHAPPTKSAARMHNNLGAAYLKTARYEEGIAEFRRAIAIDPGYLEPYYNLGMTLVALGRPAEAVPVLRQGLAVDPAHAALRSQLDVALAQSGSR